jgi:PAS domain S-box-containing protein
MNWQFTPFLIPTILAAGVAGALALFAWARRHSPGVSQFQVLMAAVVVWCLGYAMELAGVELSAKHFGALIKYLGVVLVSPAFFAFALKYSGKSEWLNLRTLSLLAVEPIVFLLLIWTNDFHGLIWPSIRLEDFGLYKARVTLHGLAFYGHALYGNLLLLLGSFLMIRTTLHRDSLYRGQSIYVVIAVFAPILGNLLCLTRLNPFRPFDLTPFSFVITGVTLALSIFRFQLLNIVPIAHDKVIRSLQDGFIVLDNLNRVIELNPAARNFIGVHDHNYIGKRSAEVFSLWPNFLELCSQASPGDSWTLAGPNDSERFFEVQMIPFQISKEPSAGRLLVLRDVTERVRTEEELQRSREELEQRVRERTDELQVINQRLRDEVKERRKSQTILQESEERYRQLVEQPFDGVYVHRGGTIVYINKTGVKLLGGKESDEFIGMSVLDFIHPESREFVEKRIQAISEGAREVPLAEEKFIRLDGNVIDVEVAGTILIYEGLASVMVVFRDITQRKFAENQLRMAHEELEIRVKERTADLEKTNLRLQLEIAEREKVEDELRRAKDLADAASRSKSDFLANMSHELRTPLNAIIGFSELLMDQESGELNPVQQEYLGDVLQSSKHLLSLINDILDLAKVEAGKMELEVKEVILPALLEGSLVMVKEKTLKHGLEVSTKLNGVPEVVEADERKLKQVVYNLLSNAVKFTPDGGQVTIRAESVSRDNGAWVRKDGQRVSFPENENPQFERRKNWVWVAVEDTGIGIREEDLERIFEPFEQVEKSASRNFQGTGLGLSLTRRIVELHGGKIWAESEGLGKGSTFTFLIPG